MLFITTNQYPVGGIMKNFIAKTIILLAASLTLSLITVNNITVNVIHKTESGDTPVFKIGTESTYGIDVNHTVDSYGIKLRHEVDYNGILLKHKNY